MPDAVASQVLIDGAARAVVKFTNISDGTGEAAVAKVVAASLAGAPQRLSIEKILYSTYGMAVDILWDATADVVAWTVAADEMGAVDFSMMGGLTNNGGAGVTGDILFTTRGHTLGDAYSIILELRKQR